MPTSQTVTKKPVVPKSDERRRSPRREHVVEASITSPTGGPAIKVTGVDLSKHGVGLSLGKFIPSGTFHVLTLGLGAQRIVGEIRVVSCRKQGDSVYRVHAEFC
jgi:hypothetical protein